MQIPSSLNAALRRLQNTNTPLGAVRVHEDFCNGGQGRAHGQSGHRFGITLSDAAMGTSTVRDYELSGVSSAQTFYAFSENQTPGRAAVSIEGHAFKQFLMTPAVTASAYMSELQQRSAMKEKTRTTLHLQDKGEIPFMRTSAVTSGRERRLRDLDQRRERFPKQELLNMLFKVFDRRNAISMRELQEYTHQPQVWICL
jgi:hypothetical protein